jgi:hypothetical protein
MAIGPDVEAGLSYMRSFADNSSQNFSSYSMIRSSCRSRISPALVGFWRGVVDRRKGLAWCLESDRCAKIGKAIWIVETMRETTVQLNDELLDFIDRQAEGDRQQAMIQALQAEANDPEYQAEIALRDCTVGDGLAAVSCVQSTF